MRTFPKLLLLAICSLSVNAASAMEQFVCQCKAQRPGYEATNRETGGIDKICSYNCNCIAWEVKKDKKGQLVASPAVPDIRLQVKDVPTTAYSKERWDFGSHICHGQWSYKPRLDDPNWKIEVKFDTFQLTANGDVFYPEDASREISQNVHESGFKYSKTAKEISSNLAEQLKEMH